MIPKSTIKDYLHDPSIWEKMIAFCISKTGEIEQVDELFTRRPVLMKYQKDIFSMISDYEKRYPQELTALDGISLQNVGQFLPEDVLMSEGKQLLQKDYLPNNTSIYINRHPWCDKGIFHEHEFIEICYVYKGVVDQILKVPGEDRQVTLSAGDVLIIPPGTCHKVLSGKEGSMLNIVVNRNTFEKTFLNSIPNQSVLYRFFSEILFEEKSGSFLCIRTKSPEIIWEAVIDLISSYTDGRTYRLNICEHKLSILFLELLQESREAQLYGTEGEKGAIVANALLYMEENYRTVSLEDVSRYVGCSCSYLNRLFQKFLNLSFLKVVQSIRMQHAKHMLDNTDLPVAEIAYQVGYEETSYFIKLFKREFGMTPLACRKRAQS